MLDKNKLLKLLVRGGAVSMGTRVTGQTLGFLVHVTLAQVLGVASYGLYALTLAWIMLLVSLSKLGFDHTLLKFASAYYDEKNHQHLWQLILFAFSRVLGASLFFVTGFILFRLIISGLGDHETIMSLLAVGAITVLMTLMGITSTLLRSFHAIFYSQFFEQILRQLVMLIPLGIMWLNGFQLDLATALLITAFGILAALVAGMHGLARRVQINPEKDRDAVTERDWHKVAAPIYMSSIVQTLSAQLGIIMLGALGSAADAGYFYAAARLSAFIAFALVAMNSMASPMIAVAWHKNDHNELAKVTTLTSRLSFGLSLTMALPMILLGQQILSLFGTEFRAAYPLLTVMLVGALVNSATAATGPLTTMTNLQKESLWTSILALVVGAILLSILIPLYGSLGAAIGVACTICVRSISRAVLIFYRIGIDASIFGRHSVE